jgi:hypothetical protein
LTPSTSPVTYSAAGEARNSATCATSAGVPNRPHGMFLIIASWKADTGAAGALSDLVSI